MTDHMHIYSRAEVDRMIVEHFSYPCDCTLIDVLAAAFSGAIFGWIANSLFHLAGWL